MSSEFYDKIYHLVDSGTFIINDDFKTDSRYDFCLGLINAYKLENKIDKDEFNQLKKRIVFLYGEANLTCKLKVVNKNHKENQWTKSKCIIKEFKNVEIARESARKLEDELNFKFGEKKGYTGVVVLILLKDNDWDTTLGIDLDKVKFGGFN